MAEADRLDSLKRIEGNLYGNLKNKQDKRNKREFIDCCKEFKFIRESNTISFNNKMNRLGITHLVLDEKYNQTHVLIKDINNPVKFGSSITIGIEGYTGTGKSELAEVITMISKQANLKYKNRIVDLFLCWFVGDIYVVLKKIKRGDVMWVDESPRTVGKGSRKEKWSVDNALHSMRKMENTFIFVDPKEIKVDTCDLYLESAGMNFETRTNRFMIMDDKRYYFGHVYVKLHDDEEFRDWYEGEKDIFIQKTLDEGGRKRATMQDDDEEMDIGEVDYFTELDSIEYVRLCIKDHNNELTIKRYSGITEYTETVSRRILDNFVKNKQISKKSGPHNIGIYYLRKKRKK